MVLQVEVNGYYLFAQLLKSGKIGETIRGELVNLFAN